ncbi:MAG: alcohol dehydrogenase catalytic domain-containing protein [Chloroflexota bacterium]
MKAVQFKVTIPKYAFGLAVGKIYPPLLWSGFSCTSMQTIPQPTLINEEWVRIKTRYGGICGSDLGAIYLTSSPYYTPFISDPATLGHENDGYIDEVGSAVSGWQKGDRVVVEPFLWCGPRGFASDEMCEFCARGEINLCEHTTMGTIAPGVQMGVCRDTGGSWSAEFLAHQTQLYKVPDNVSDENAMMAEPFAIVLHAALIDFP